MGIWVVDLVAGAHKRFDRLDRDVVLATNLCFARLLVECANGAAIQLFETISLRGRRSIVRRNEARVEKGGADRRAIVAAQSTRLELGGSALIGDLAFPRGTAGTAAIRQIQDRAQIRPERGRGLEWGSGKASSE